MSGTDGNRDGTSAENQPAVFVDAPFLASLKGPGEGELWYQANVSTIPVDVNKGL